MRFHERLAQLGYATYSAYLYGEHWTDFKKRYYAKNGPVGCAVCGDRPVDLHHHTYERLGEELFDDITPLCPGHHIAVHDWLKKYKNGAVAATHKAVSALRGETHVKPKQPVAKSKPVKEKKTRREKKAERKKKRKAKMKKVPVQKKPRGETPHETKMRQKAQMILAYHNWKPPPSQAPTLAHCKATAEDTERAASEMRKRLLAIREGRK